MSQQKKILIAVFAIAFFVLVIIVFQPKEGTAPVLPLSNVSSDDKEEVKLPKPTGKVDDAVSAVVSEATEENDWMINEEKEAQEAVDVAEEANDFGAAYDENEF